MVNSRDSGTVSGLGLADGDTYSVAVTSCSAAGLCSRAESHTPIQVDSTSPVDGYFAVATGSTFPRNASLEMTWRNRPRAGDSRITLAFYSFSDAHSGISEYWTEIGTGFGRSDLTQGSRLLSPSPVSDTGARTATVATVGHVVVNQTLYVALWAVNGVGLESRRVHGSFMVQEVEGQDTRGTLYHVRSSLCTLDSCYGHCTCAARGDLCPLTNSDVMSCVEVDISVVEGDQRVGVVNVAPQQTAGDELFTSITDKLVGRWEVPSPYHRLEWTVGEKGGVPGRGLFDASVDQIWREAGSSVSAIFSVNPLYPLKDGETYVFYIRAWFNHTHFVVFQSSGITVDVSGPRVVTGGRLREGGSGDQGTEVDFSANQTTIEVTWNGVFINELSEVHSTYHIGIGDVPGSDNVVEFTPVPRVPNLAGLSAALSHGTTYFTSLRVTSPLSVTMDTISDGFTVDTSPPEVGVVFDGLDYWDSISQSDTRSLSARWAGFHDAESGIHHYEMAWSDTVIPAVDLEYVNVGIGLRWTVTGLNLDHGVTYYIHISAVNGAGVWSEIVSSNGITVDTTRPEQLHCEWTALNISLFESISPGASPCNDTTLEAGVLSPSPSFSPLSGCVSQLVTDSLSLPLSTLTGALYSLSFWLTRYPGGSGCGHMTPLLARVVVPGLEEVVAVHTRNGDTLHRWSRFQFQFRADGPSSMLSLSTISDQYSLVVDGLSVSQCTSIHPIPISDVITNRSSVFYVSQEHMSGMWTRLRAWWEVGEEGGVREYQWAIGTIERGEQLQPYTSTGMYSGPLNQDTSEIRTPQSGHL